MTHPFRPSEVDLLDHRCQSGAGISGAGISRVCVYGRSLVRIGLLVVIVAAAFAAAPSMASAQGITGQVYDSETGEPVPAANVIVRNRAKEVVARGTTDDAGQFTIEVGATGLFLISVERSGYASDVSASVTLSEGEMREIEVVVTPDETDNPGISVNEDGLVGRLQSVGYYQRKRRARGAFIEPTREDVSRGIRIDELIRREASRVRVVNNVATVRSSRGGRGLCALKVLVDGIDTNSVRLESRRRFRTSEIQAIEVYWSDVNVPARWQVLLTGARNFGGGRTQVCGLVAIWLR
jgi:carboxypeptidase family protein